MEYSLTTGKSLRVESSFVLILILMEYSLTHRYDFVRLWTSSVLILILMEYSLTAEECGRQLASK